MAKKPGLDFDEHEALGRELWELRNRLLQISVRLSNAYAKTSRVDRAGQLAVSRVDALRSALDDECALEHPDRFTPAVYYPGQYREVAARA